MNSLNITLDQVINELNNKSTKIIENKLYPNGDLFKKLDICCGNGSEKKVYIGIYENGKKNIEQQLIIWSEISILELEKGKYQKGYEWYIKKKNRIMNEYNINKYIIGNKLFISNLKAWKDNHKLVFINEYADKGDLQMYINFLKYKEKGFSEKTILDILFQILNGLHYLHELNIIHRDIKPSNIVICKDKYKIIDFGISTKFCNNPNKLRRVESLTDENENNNLEYFHQNKDEDEKNKKYNLGSMKGTIEYMAPEVFEMSLKTKKIEYNKSVDLYSLGWLLFSLITLDFPYTNTIPIPIIKDNHISSSLKIGNLQNSISCLYKEEESTINNIVNIELTKIAYYNKNNELEHTLESLPNMSIIKDIFIQKYNSPFKNPKLTYLDFFIDCINKPNLRLNTFELLEKYF
jgi:serine/threonine protein kinase